MLRLSAAGASLLEICFIQVGIYKRPFESSNRQMSHAHSHREHTLCCRDYNTAA